MTSFREVRFLKTQSGKVPFYNWYLSLRESQIRATIQAKVGMLENPKFRNYKSVGRGVFELRIFVGAGYRIYFGFQDEHIVIIIGGGQKKTQPKDIKNAQLLWRRFINADRPL